jgi:hypothetical protein
MWLSAGLHMKSCCNLGTLTKHLTGEGVRDHSRKHDVRFGSILLVGFGKAQLPFRNTHSEVSGKRPSPELHSFAPNGAFSPPFLHLREPSRDRITDRHADPACEKAT